MSAKRRLSGERFVIDNASEMFPENLSTIARPPKKLYGVGNPEALQAGLAVIGARKATPYGESCARRFSRIAAEKGIVIISGGARGCDSEAHRAALSSSGMTVAFLGGGCDEIYPAGHFTLFQRMIDAGGAVVSEHPWDTRPLPYLFRERNRLIAGLAAAVLIVEAGLPSGTFSTADEALDAGREVLVVPGSITSPVSLGSNRLLFQGATPIVDDESFEEVLFRVFGCLKRPLPSEPGRQLHPIVEAIRAEPMGMEELYSMSVRIFGADEAQSRLMELLVEAEASGVIARHPGGKWGPTVQW